MSDTDRFVRIEMVAHSYGCDVTWLVRVHARGLLPASPSPGTHPVLVAVEDLDRVAQLVRWHLLGVDLDLLEVLLAGARGPGVRW